VIFAIVGSRDFTDYALFKSIVDWYLPQMTGVVSGGARGADTLAERYAREQNIPLTVHNAEWNLHGKKAGYLRNKLIVRDADHMIAFLVSNSKGTQHSIDLAHDKGIPVDIINI